MENPCGVLAAGRTGDGSAVLLSKHPFGRTSWLRIRSGDDATACLSIRLRLLGNRACRLSPTGSMVQYDDMRPKRCIHKRYSSSCIQSHYISTASGSIQYPICFDMTNKLMSNPRIKRLEIVKRD